MKFGRFGRHIVQFAVTVLVVGVGCWFGAKASTTQSSASYAEPAPLNQASQVAIASPDPEPAETSTPEPTVPEYYEGNVASLPETARQVLAFEPAGSSVQVNSESIANRLYNLCELTDYIGADDFPGRIRVADEPHGWTRVTWTVAKCPTWDKGQMTMIFRLSHDGTHIEFRNTAALMLSDL